MESFTRNVRDISPTDKLALEYVIGQQLAENQKVIIQICSFVQPQRPLVASHLSSGLPDWCNVYAGLKDEQVAAIEHTVLQRADLTRIVD